MLLGRSLTEIFNVFLLNLNREYVFVFTLIINKLKLMNTSSIKPTLTYESVIQLGRFNKVRQRGELNWASQLQPSG